MGRAVGRSGRHRPHRRQGARADPERSAPAPLARHGRQAHPVPGIARAHLLGGPRATGIASAWPSTTWWPAASFRRPIVIGRDHLDSGSVASPNRETEAMRDGSDAVSDWPLLNALLNTASGATWVSFHHGGGVGMGYSQHAGVVIVCDGTPAAARRIERVLWNDPATGVMRHADAGYEIALQCAREHYLAAADAHRRRRRHDQAPHRRLGPARRGLDACRRCARRLSAPVDMRLTRADSAARATLARGDRAPDRAR